jgi:hypothetical protein
MRGAATLEERVGQFFTFARERHTVYLRRTAGEPFPGTHDPILSQFRFTNVYRELDRTTIALRRLTDQMRDDPRVLLLIVALRWFNRTSTWGRLMSVGSSGLESLIENLKNPHSRVELQRHLRTLPAPHVTGAYIVKTPPGMDKLAGVWDCIEKFATHIGTAQISSGDLETNNWLQYAERLLTMNTSDCPSDQRPTLRSVWEWLLPQSQMGPFMAYEVVSDLRHTALLDRAPDIMTWASAGPGAMRGLNRIHDRDLFFARRSHNWLGEMSTLLRMSQDGSHWPRPTDSWPSLEMREIEHTLCEFDKYQRVRLGEGRPRGVFVPEITTGG